MSDLRIFSYLPNPRIWKATIAARLCGVEVDVRGAKGSELGQWLWDFDARPLTDADRADPALQRQGRTGFRGNLFKTDAFMAAHPFGTVPAAFSPDGACGVFESNSIMRAVARLGADSAEGAGLYGGDAYEASRIDSFLDASLVFARDSQVYLLALGSRSLDAAIHGAAKAAFDTYLGGIDTALAHGNGYIVGAGLTLADICFCCEIALFSRERAWVRTVEAIDCTPIDWTADSAALAHYDSLCSHPAFAPELGPFRDELKANIDKHAG